MKFLVELALTNQIRHKGRCSSEIGNAALLLVVCNEISFSHRKPIADGFYMFFRVAYGGHFVW